jgi:hypothetical protein
MKEGAGAGEEGEIFEVLEEKLKSDVEARGGNEKEQKEMLKMGKAKIFQFLEVLRSENFSKMAGEDEVQIIYQKQTMVSGVASQVLGLKPQVLKDFLDEKFYDVVHHRWEGEDLLPNRKFL